MHGDRPAAFCDHNSPLVTEAYRRLESWFHRSPEWFRLAYTQNPLAHAVIKEAAIAGKIYDRMLIDLVEKLLAQADQQFQQLVSVAENSTKPIIICPSPDPELRAHLDRAEVLLCNAETPKHCEQKTWERILRKFRDEKHRLCP